MKSRSFVSALLSMLLGLGSGLRVMGQEGPPAAPDDRWLLVTFNGVRAGGELTYANAALLRMCGLPPDQHHRRRGQPDPLHHRRQQHRVRL